MRELITEVELLQEVNMDLLIEAKRHREWLRQDERALTIHNRLIDEVAQLRIVLKSAPSLKNVRLSFMNYRQWLEKRKEALDGD